jgi:hypothetical protein
MMPDPLVSGFTAGLLTAGYLIAGLFFLRFWDRTRDVLFASFAFAFALMAINQALPPLLQVPSENQAGIYLLRLVAFGTIIAAVLLKNVRRLK